MSYVRRPSSRSYSPEIMPSNGPMSPVKNGCVQPPSAKPLVGSSSGPPGACMTPSSEMKTAPVSLRIDGLPAQRGFDPGDVDLLHRHHRLERALGRGPVRIVHGLEQDARGDLPRKAPFVLAPAAHALLAAVADDGVPVAVGLFLVLGRDHEADGFVRLEHVAAVEADEALAKHGEVHRDFIALFSAGRLRRRVVRLADPAV